MSKMVFKKSENLKKSQNIFFFFFKAEKKRFPLSFPILGGRHSTRALQPAGFRNTKISKHLKKLLFFNQKIKKNKIKKMQKKNAILLVFQN